MSLPFRNFWKCKVIRKESKLLLESNMNTVIMSLSFSRLHNSRFVLVFTSFGQLRVLRFQILVSCYIITLFSISFPEPTCLLVSTKTRSSGIINYQRPRFQDVRFHGACFPWFTWRLEIVDVDASYMYRHSIRAGKTRKVEIWLLKNSSVKFKSKRHEGSGNQLVDYSRAPCLGADQKAHGLWERDCIVLFDCYKNYKLCSQGIPREF